MYLCDPIFLAEQKNKKNKKKRTNRARYDLKVKNAFTMTIVSKDGIVPEICLTQQTKFKIYSISYCMDYYAMKTVQNSCIFYFDFIYLNLFRLIVCCKNEHLLDRLIPIQVEY